MPSRQTLTLAMLLGATVALADEPADGGQWAGRTVVLAHVEKLTGSYGTTTGPCRLSLVVLAVDALSSRPGAPAAKVGDRLDVSTSCYTSALHQMQQPGTFRFRSPAIARGRWRRRSSAGGRCSGAQALTRPALAQRSRPMPGRRERSDDSTGARYRGRGARYTPPQRASYQ